MELPIVTNLPLELLASDPRKALDMSRSSLDGLTALGTDTMWRLLTYTRPRLTAALTAAKLSQGPRSTIRPRRTPQELDELLSEVVPHIGFGMLPAELREVPVDTPIEQIFVPQKRPPITPEQIAFLRSEATVLLPETVGAQRVVEHSWIDEMHCGIVWDVAMHVVHMRPGEFHGVPDHLRARIEAVVGLLPLQLTADEMAAIEAIDD